MFFPEERDAEQFKDGIANVPDQFLSDLAGIALRQDQPDIFRDHAFKPGLFGNCLGQPAAIIHEGQGNAGRRKENDPETEL
jgi:hypothetical protein